VINGNTSSCGCLGQESRIKHGLSQTLEYHREATRQWAKRNPGKVLENAYKRKEYFVLRVPKWLTEEQKVQIDELYREAHHLTNITGQIHHVDHIVPLRGKQVSGLHVPWNLRVTTAEENLRKAHRLLDEIC
jgi:5-methylcytosine-specific restriction endonuclease McrA